MSRKYTIFGSFRFAVAGIKEAITNEPNFRSHLFVATVTVGAAYFFGFNKTEWMVLVFTISLILILELINTAIEAIVDLVSPQIRAKAKIAKDVSAAAVFLASITALLVGLFLFIPKLQQLLL